MSSQLFNQLNRIRGIKDTLEEKILDLAKLQIKIHQEEAAEIFKIEDSKYPIKWYYSYLKISEYGETIDCYEYNRGGSDEKVDDFKIDPLVLEGKYNEFRAQQRGLLLAQKKQKDNAERLNKANQIVKLTAELEALTK